MQRFAFAVLAIVAAFFAYTVATRLHDGCRMTPGGRRGVMVCPAPAAPSHANAPAPKD
jgi:hypothetical protein